MTREEWRKEGDEFVSLIRFVNHMLPGVFKYEDTKVVYDTQEEEWIVRLYYADTEENITCTGSLFQIRNTLNELIRQALV